MQTTIKSVEVEWVGSGAKKYGKAAVKHDNGKGERTQYLVSFKNPEVFKRVQELVNQTVEVENVKVGDFWEWRSINVAGVSSGTNAASPAAGTSTRVTGSNYETKEERAARQVMIAKQSSLDRAVEILKHNNPKDKIEADAVKALAQDLTDWVLGTKAPDMSVEGMLDDIPY